MKRPGWTYGHVVVLIGLFLGLSGCASERPTSQQVRESARPVLGTANAAPAPEAGGAVSAPPYKEAIHNTSADVPDTTGPGETPAAILPDSLVGGAATPVIPAPSEVVLIDLPAALERAGGENPSIAIAQTAVRVALAQQQAACALLLPNLNAGMDFDHHDGALQNASGVIREVNRQSLYFGAGAGAIGAGPVAVPGVQLFSPIADALFAPQTAKQVVATRRYDAVAANNSGLLEVGVLYYTLVGAEARLASLRQSVSEFAEVVRLTAENAKAAQGLQSDADRASSEALLLKQDEQGAQGEVVVASARLAQQLNWDPSVRIQVREEPIRLLELVDPHAALESLIETALASRPEMKARSAAIAAAATRYRQEKFRPFLPTLSIGYSAGGFGGGSNLTDPSFGSFNSRTDFDVYAFWTLQNLGFGNLSLQKRRRAEVDEAQAELLATVNQIRDEVSEASTNLVTGYRDLGVARRKLERASDGMRRDLQRIRALEGRPIEVLNSARLLAEARQQFVSALIQYNQSQLRLFVSLGQPPSLQTPTIGNLPGPEAPSPAP